MEDISTKDDCSINERVVPEQTTAGLIQEISINEDNDIDLLCAVVFIEDAAKYRDISHKLDKNTLLWYRWYHSQPVRVSFYFVVFVLHILAFFEYPSSLTWTSDIRHRGSRIAVPCGVTEGIEMICFLLIAADLILKYKLIGRSEFIKKKWLWASSIILILSLIDWFITIGFSCKEIVRYRRILRPVFIISNSQLMKKTVKCVQKTLPEVITILLLLFIHLYIFTLLGMLLFPKPQSFIPMNNRTAHFINGNASSNSSTDSNVTEEGDEYFKTLLESFMSLLVLLTTANNPDVMMPAYQENRLFSVYFIVFMVIGNYCFMNMFLAVIYNQFRGYFKSSMQASLLRRRVGLRAAYEVLLKSETSTDRVMLESSVEVTKVKNAIQEANLPIRWKSKIYNEIDLKQVNQQLNFQAFQDCVDVIQSEKFSKNRPAIRWFGQPVLRFLQKCVAHRFFTYFGNLVAVVNVFVITVELATQYDKSFNYSKSVLNIVNFGFVTYYLLEQVLKFVMFGWRRYIFEKSNIYDGLITVALVVTEIFSVAEYGLPLTGDDIVPQDSVTLWNVVRIINILIMARILRIIPQIKSMSIVVNTLVDLIKNMKAFAGILIVIYYSFAIMGIEIFNGSIKYNPPNATVTRGLLYKCGSYQQLEYWANNFDDFAAAIVVLWDIMVVNNWSVFLNAYKSATSRWAYLFFIIWWLFSVVIVLQLFTAIIIENFIMKWDKSQLNTDRGRRTSSFEDSHHFMSVHDMFRSTLEEPSESEILQEISNHRYLKLRQIPSVT
ncbi:two pore channel protein 2-like isoform X1 [Mytilus trossulus]|uniref:two pore channel protein 2-like isoform X1 n=2 Tax=Mytilus trossulus TaxID=6551 RepID=UPI0030050AD4